ncbi:MAG: c-type cytochrome [Terriglobales bacterium]
MKKLFLIVSVAALLALAACKAGKPGRLETSVVQEVKKQVTIGGKDWKNPAPDTEASVKEGAKHFQHHCQVCHGLDGHATGVPFAAMMDPPVPDLGSKDVQEYADGQLKWIIENGIAPSGMPGWKGMLDDDEMWKIVRFMRKLPPAGSLGAPKIYAEGEGEHEEMEMDAKPGEAKPHTHTHKH